MSQDKITVPVPGQKLPPVYQNSFVGIWKRMFLSGRPDENQPFLYFNRAGKAFGHLGPGSRRGEATVMAILPDPKNAEKGILKVKFRYRTVEWNYTLNRNNAFKAEFRPFPGSNRNAPVLNELLLVGQGARHLYAFLSHPSRPLMPIKEIERILC